MASNIGQTVRDVADDEVAAYRANGWVKLPQFITPALAGALLDRLKAKMGADASAPTHPNAARAREQESMWRIFAPLSVDAGTGETIEPLFQAVSQAPELGRAMIRLQGAAMRYGVDQALVKAPAGQGGDGETIWHADVGAEDCSPFSPAGGASQVWIALAPVTPDQGAMRFIAPSHMTDEVRRVIAELGVSESYPVLERMGVISEPLTLQPGDATVHGSATLHSAPPNQTDDPRWGYVVTVFPEDCVWTGKPWWPIDAVPDRRAGEPFPDHRFPRLVA